MVKRFAPIATAAIFALGVVPCSTAYANGQAAVRPVWDQFVQRCGLVLRDPDAYLESLQVPGALGERVTSLSPDKHYLSILNFAQPGYEEVGIFVVGNRQVRRCSVKLTIDSNGVSSGIAQTIKPIFDELRNAGVQIVGGHVPQDFPTGDMGTSAVFPVNELFSFAVLGLWPDLDVHATVSLVSGQFHGVVQHEVRAEQ